jgi:hypothetical protein
MKTLKFRQWQSLGRPRDSVTRDASDASLFKLQIFERDAGWERLLST